MTTVKLIDPDSGVGFDNRLDLFNILPSNVAIVKSRIREILPIATITQEGPYTFRDWADNQFRDLSKTFVYLELGIEKQKDVVWVPIEKEKKTKDPTDTTG